MLTLVPIDTYVAKASCPFGPVTLMSSSSHAATDNTRAMAAAGENQLRVTTIPQRGATSGATPSGLIISALTETRATLWCEWHRRAHRAWEEACVRYRGHSDGRPYEDRNQ